MSIHERVAYRTDRDTGERIVKRNAKGEAIKTFEVRFRGPDGRERSRTFKTITDARKYEREQLVERDRGTWIDPRSGKLTLSEWADQWLRTVVNLRPSSRRIYETNLRRHVLPKVGTVELGSMRLTGITTEVARAWLAALTVEPMTRDNPRTGERVPMTRTDPATGVPVPRQLAPATVHQAYRTLNAVMQAAVECDRITKNPMTAVKPPKVEQVPMRFLTVAEVMRLADEIGPEYRALVLVAAFCGLRRGELGGLRWCDVNLLARRIDVTNQLDADTSELAPLKTKSSRRPVSMPAVVAEALGAHATFGASQDAGAGSSGFVFAAPGGGPLDLHNFRARVWVPAVERAGLDGLRLHDMRHTCASLAIAAGADVKVLQRMLGHASAAMTLDRYGHLMPGQSEQVANRLDALVAHAATATNAG